MNALRNRKTLGWCMVALLPVVSTGVYAQGAVAPEYRWLTFAVFAAIIALTIGEPKNRWPFSLPAPRVRRIAIDGGGHAQRCSATREFGMQQQG